MALTGVWLTMRQKERSERRAEWWRRVTWSVERTADADVTVARIAIAVLTSLMISSLATETERDLIEALALADLPDLPDNDEVGST
ncbi:hypothetical protein TSOC111612_12605 [Tsukamurella ocularis]